MYQNVTKREICILGMILPVRLFQHKLVDHFFHPNIFGPKLNLPLEYNCVFVG